MPGVLRGWMLRLDLPDSGRAAMTAGMIGAGHAGDSVEMQVRAGRWRFGNATLDGGALELRVDDAPVAIEPKALALLLALLRRPGEVVTKDELLDAVWAGRVVTEGVLVKAVAKVRAALGDADGTLVRAVHGYGYRLVAEVTLLPPAATPLRDLDLDAGQPIPGRPNWILERALGEGGHGEVWLAAHAKTHERRVFKFARDGAGLTALKREITLFRLLNDTLGERADLVPILDWNLEEPPYFLESAWSPAGSLLDWSEAIGGIDTVPLPQRLELVAEAADALAAAHGVGVLHKDIKPGNVLVELDAAQTPRARLGDFGSGRVLDPDQLDALGITRLGYTHTQADSAGATSGTPLYTAPEVLAGQPPTIRSDIYSLGVLLYQMAVGDLRRPLAPGWERGIDDPLLREDIAACVDGDPSRRLADAAELARRLRSFDARRAEREKLVTHEAEIRRTREALAQAQARRRWLAALAAVLTLGLFATAALSLQLLRARDAVLAEAGRADQQAARANAVNRFLVDDLLASAIPLASGEGDPGVRTVLARAVDSIGSRFVDQPETEVALRITLARAFLALSEPTAARAQAERARSLLEKIGDTRDTLRLQADNVLAGILELEGRFAEAQALLGETPASTPDASATEPELEHAGLSALIEMRLGRPAEAVARFDALLPALRARHGVADIDVLTAEQNRGEALLQAGDVNGALAALQAMAATARANFGEADLRTAHYSRPAAMVAYRLGNHRLAHDTMAPIVDVLVAELGSRHVATLNARGDLAMILKELDRLDEAEAMQRALLADARAALGARHVFTALVLGNLAHVLEGLQRFEEALALGREALALKTDLHGATSEPAVTQTHNIARYLQQLGRWQEAEAQQRELIPRAVQALGAGHWQVGLYQAAWGESLARLGRIEPARAQLDQGIAALTPVFGADHHFVMRYARVRDELAALPAPTPTP